MRFKNFQRVLLFIIILLAITIFASGGETGVLSVKKPTDSEVYQPLDQLTILSEKPGRLELFDGENNLYCIETIKKEQTITLGGALGVQKLVLKDKSGNVLDKINIPVNCQTEINDKSGKYKDLLDILYTSMVIQWEREANVVKYDGDYYHYFVSWLRDHVHTLKGMKYFYPELKSGIDLYADSQREDGMIWDNYKHYYDETQGSYWVQRFRYEDFVKTAPENKRLFTRIPVENDVEYLFIEGLYFTWKASGDDLWMMSLLDHALKALDYSRTGKFRWSEKYGLLKRGYTIDTWDFQNDEDARISSGKGNIPDPMKITENTRFGIMYGDNTGMANACKFLAEMLAYAGRKKESKEVAEFGRKLQQRIDELAWNGHFYRHHVPEDPTVERDFGVDESQQVSLSNAYTLNRNITHDQAVEIIKTYQRIREEMPAAATGEFFTIYPPFQKGFGGHNSLWNYMNGGVTSIVAGELAHGAFVHGFEDYGVDILERMRNLANQTDGFLECTYRGVMPTEPERTFTTINLASVANTDFFGKTVKGVNGWTGEGENDLHEFPVDQKKFEGILFDIIDPAENNRRAVLGISSSDGYSENVRLTVNQTGKSVYLLHCANNNYYAGRVTLHYEDGSHFSDEIGRGKILNWWYPSTPEARKQMPKLKVAWRGKNAMSDRVGVCVYGLNNPNPDKEIKHIEFEAAQNGTKWMVLGVTLSDYPVHFVPGIVSGGIPMNWGAAAVTYALVEGLAGVKNEGTAFEHALIAPRWTAADVDEVSTKIKLEASNSYVAYDYKFTGENLTMQVTGNGNKQDYSILLPKDKKGSEVLINGQSVDFEINKVEASKYVTFSNRGRGVFDVVVNY
ncbi:MAG: hypothetical protein ACLFQM_06775 [Fidelibacterota bacterium]